MSNTHFSRFFIQASVISALVLGITCVGDGWQKTLAADIIGKTETLAQGPTHPAAAAALYQQAFAGYELIIGLLLILLGFFLHAYLVSRTGERNVHITSVAKDTKTTLSTQPAASRSWYWIEMKI
jgi:hypothetical protein